MNQRKRWWGVAAVLLLGGGGWVVWGGFRPGDDSMAEVAVAKSYLPVGTVLDKSHATIVNIPKAYVQPGAVSRKTDLQGQITVAQIAEGEQILANKISESPASVSSSIPFGSRAYTLPGEAAAGLTGLIKPGDVVDVLATVEGSEGQREIIQTVTLVQHVRIIAIGSRFGLPSRAGASKKAMEEMGRLSNGEAITVAVTAQEAEVLAFAEQRGRLKVVVRSVGDTETHASRTVNFNSLLKGAVSSPKASSPSTQIIQGIENEGGSR